MKLREKMLRLMEYNVGKECLDAIFKESSNMFISFTIRLELENTDHKKLKYIHSRIKEIRKDLHNLIIKSKTLTELTQEFINIEKNKRGIKEGYYGQSEEESDNPDEDAILLPVLMNEYQILKEKLHADHIDYSLDKTKDNIIETTIKILFLEKLIELYEKYMIIEKDKRVKALLEKRSSEAEYTEAIVVDKVDEPQTIVGLSSPLKFPQLFKDKGYELFTYLNTEYTRDNSNPKAKFSYLFHFLSYQELLICTKLDWIAFVRSATEIQLSRIQDKTPKYEDIIFPLLSRLKANFDKIHKVEMN